MPSMETPRINKYMQKNDIKIIICILSTVLNRECKLKDLFGLKEEEQKVLGLKLYRFFIEERKKVGDFGEEVFFSKKGEILCAGCSSILSFIKINELIYFCDDLFEMIIIVIKASPSYNSASSEIRKFIQFIFSYILRNEIFLIKNYAEEICLIFGEFIERNHKAIFLSLSHIDLKIFRSCIIVSMAIFNEYPEFLTEKKMKCKIFHLENLLLFLHHFLALDCRKYLNTKKTYSYIHILLGRKFFTKEKLKKSILCFFDQVEVEEMREKVVFLKRRQKRCI